MFNNIFKTKMKLILSNLPLWFGDDTYQKYMYNLGLAVLSRDFYRAHQYDIFVYLKKRDYGKVIKFSFVWSQSPEGSTYWRSLYIFLVGEYVVNGK